MHAVAFVLAMLMAIASAARQSSHASSRLLASLDRAPPLPENDPFYRPPNGYERRALGAVLRQRKIRGAFNNVPALASAYQILYRTSTTSGSPLATVTTVFVPHLSNRTQYISFQLPEDSAALFCSPSYNFRQGANQTNAVGAFAFEIETLLTKGYIVSSPDYEGPDSAFSVGHLEGKLVLDGMRAVLNFGQMQNWTAHGKAAYVGYGYSGGAIATGWAASLQRKYANDLPIRGFAFGGTPSNMTGTALYVDGTQYSGFIPTSLEGMAQPSTYRDEIQPVYDQILTQAGKDALDYTTKHCEKDDLKSLNGSRWASAKYCTPGERFFYEPTVHKDLTKSLMAHRRSETPIVPIMMAHGSADEIIPYNNASHTAKTWCKYGAHVDFLTVINGTHGSTAATSFPATLGFIDAAFNRKTLPRCSRHSIHNF